MDYLGLKNIITCFPSIEVMKSSFTEYDCINFVETFKWPNGISCPSCGSEKLYKTDRGYKCSNSVCYQKTSLITGTIFENSKLSLKKWFEAIYLFDRINSTVQFSEKLNITQKIAWLVYLKLGISFYGENRQDDPFKKLSPKEAEQEMIRRRIRQEEQVKKVNKSLWF